jgi:ATP-dependent Zn protease
MFQRGVFVVAFIGEGKSPVKRLFETARETRHG